MKLTGEERVSILLALVPYYRERQYNGNYYDNDDLNDILDALERARLTDKQRQAIDLVLINDLTHREAALRMSVGRRAVSYLVERAVKLVAEEYEKGNMR